ncbi:MULTISPECIES: helix-turn-helix transcriptional regulator [Paenibacillus]|uniref:AraC family transcriptional regulator n=1 Tax=Paenibacillus campinasensis TaxID=66347 RepID=A0A268EZ05_9BACL|nr:MULTISPECIES: AraC family transcriptional regulator [Paenibacillus]PAD78304.1 AraC family transcriptional regulator [Paenibacillus campinasensis]PAK52413.1 AraC family transcriptional regulator [Paenibacillus sp. 7541]
MTKPFQAEYHDPDGKLGIEYDRRVGHFSMTDTHLHEHYELYYLMSGERVYFIKDRSYRIKAGDLVFVDRNTVHRTLDSGRPDHDRIVFYIEPELIEGACSDDLAGMLLEPFRWDVPILRLPSPEDEVLARGIDDIFGELLHPGEGSGMLLRHRTLELLLYAYRNREAGRVGNAEDGPPVVHPRMQAIVRYVNDNYRKSLALTEVAGTFRISPYYLSRLFKQTTGFAFSDYLNLLRIREAQRLLRETDLAVTEIAWSAGFGNFSHFGKMFKRTVGASPREYRRRYRR